MKKLVAVLLTLALLLGCTAALAEWPERSIELIVPANPGGDTDANARALAAALNEQLGWNVIVSNMAGGSGAVAFEDCMNNPDDGYRFVFYHSGACTSELMSVYDFNVTGDFKLAGMPFMDYSSAFIINTKNEKFNDLASMIAYMKDHPGEVTFATETGNFTHLHALAFEAAAGVQFSIVDAGTASQKVTELLGQRLDVIDTQVGLVRDYLDTKEFSVIGITAEERLSGRPEVPTFKENGLDIVFPKFFYVAAPNAVDDAVINAMNEGLKAVCDNAGLNEYATNQLVVTNYMTPDETEAFYTDSLETYRSYLADYID